MDNFDLKKYLYNNYLLKESELGSQQDIDFQKYTGNVLPYEELLYVIEAEWGKEDLYYEIEQAIFDKDFEAIVDILINHGVWDDYKNILNLNEESVTGGGTEGSSSTPGVGMNYATPKSFKKKVKETSYGAGNLGPGPKATEQGVKDNYYVKKFGYEPVNRKKQAKNSKAIDYKDLWGSTYK